MDEEIPCLPLKFKYCDPANIPVRKNGKMKARTGNSRGGPKLHSDQGNGPRRRMGLGATQQ